MKKRCQRGPQKSCFGIQDGDMGLPGSTYPLIFDVLVRCQKIIIFGCLPDGPKNRAVERQIVKRSLRVFASAKFLGGRGPQNQLKVGPFDHWTSQKGSRHAVGPKARRIYMYICIYIYIYSCMYENSHAKVYKLLYIYIYIYV